jgi:hypothetical protein
VFGATAFPPLEEIAAQAATVSDGGLATMVDECTRARARIDAVEATVLAEIARRDLARGEGRRDTAEWLAHRTGVSAATAKRRVAMADIVDHLDAAAAALAAGDITEGHVGAMANASDEVGLDKMVEAQEQLVAWARRTTTDRFRRQVRSWVIEVLTASGIDPTRRAQAQRRVSLQRGDHGSGLDRLLAELPVEDMAVVAGELWRLVKDRWRSEKDAAMTTTGAVSKDQDQSAGREVADVGHGLIFDETSTGQRLADALVEMSRRSANASGADIRGRSRPSVIVVIDADTLLDRVGRSGLARLADGTPVPASTARRLACDAGVLPVVLGGESQPLDVGRERRTVTRYQRAAMLARRGHCEWPGCTVPADWCDAHHLVPWEARGPTDINNLAFMCNTHHHDAHEGGWDVRRHLLTGEIVVDPPSPRSASVHQARAA